MAQAPAPIVYKNVLPWRGCEKLYLDARTADVLFVFKSDDEDTVKIPAHKSILSANSEVFDAMFYGPAKQNGDIPIVCSTPEVFTEFLQFFYLATVKLTMENAADVLNLGKQYMVDDCCMATSNVWEQTLTLDNVFWRYEMAILFDQTHLMKICERKISENPKVVFQSNSFLSCGPNVLARILQLESLNCEELMVFDGCMAWAKAACMQKGLDETNMQNLRNQLGHLFFEIRFGEMTIETFFMRYHAYEKLFSLEEFRDIIGMIASKDYRPSKFSRSARTVSPNNGRLICSRRDPFACFDHGQHYIHNQRIDTVFSSNRALLLNSIVCGTLFLDQEFQNSGMYTDTDKRTTAFSTDNIPTSIQIIELSNGRRSAVHVNGTEYDKKTIYSDEVVLHSSQETIVNLLAPIAIRPDAKYNIVFNIYLAGCYTTMTLKSTVRLEQGIKIEFHKSNGNIYLINTQGLVRELIFGKSE